MRKFGLIPPFLLAALAACTALIAPAPSNVGPQPPYNVFQVCIPGAPEISIELGSRSAGGGGRNLGSPLVGKSTSGQAVYEGALSYGDDGIYVMLSPLAAGASPRVYLYPIQGAINDNWSSWIEPAQLDSSIPLSIDRMKRFKSPESFQLSGAPKVRWRAEPVSDYNESRVSSRRYGGIPSC